MMDNRYLFRGKRIDNGKWVTGGLVPPMNCTGVRYATPHIYFSSGPRAQVDPATIGQCTGLKDKNGKLIFEGDILKCKCRNKEYDPFGEKNKESQYISKIAVIEHWNSYTRNGYRLKFRPKNQTMMVAQSALSTMEAETIGNIYDSFELLEPQP